MARLVKMERFSHREVVVKMVGVFGNDTMTMVEARI